MTYQSGPFRCSLKIDSDFDDFTFGMHFYRKLYENSLPPTAILHSNIFILHYKQKTKETEMILMCMFI